MIPEIRLKPASSRLVLGCTRLQPGWGKAPAPLSSQPASAGLWVVLLIFSPFRSEDAGHGGSLC